MKNIFILTLSIGLLWSCAQKNAEELKELDEVQVKLTALKETFEDVDMKAVKNARDTYKENMSQIKQHYRSDTIEMTFGITLNHYKGIKKAGKNIDQLHLNYANDLSVMETQLNNLKTDIVNNSWKKDSIKSFVDFERTKVEELGDNIGTFIVNCEYIIQVHDSLADKVREFTVIF